jgi:hypothetical protein
VISPRGGAKRLSLSVVASRRTSRSLRDLEGLIKGFSVKLHMQRLIDFMGDESVWKTMVPGVVIRRRFSRHVQSYPTAYFVESHWTSRKANSSELFDPYNHYQKPGTHKFCQTFAMMHLLCVLPPPVYDYKTYDMYARRFIKKVLDRLPNDHPAFLWDSQRNVRTSLRCPEDTAAQRRTSHCVT